MIKRLCRSLLFHINNLFLNHQAFAAILLALLTPTTIQLLYSIPLFEPKVSSNAVLQFCGVMFGFLFAATAYSKKRSDDDLRRMRELTPHLEMSIRCSDGKASICITNNSAHALHEVCIGGSKPLFSIAAGDSGAISFTYDLLNKGNGIFLKRDINHPNKILVTLTFLDEDGNHWQTSFSSINQCCDGAHFALEQGALVGIGQ